MSANQYTVEELRNMIVLMYEAANIFYSLAQRTGVHAFLEFTGLIREYIKICERSLAEGRDFTQTNIHVRQPLKIELFEIAYLGEKLGCIYGTGLQTAEAWAHLKAAMQGNPPPTINGLITPSSAGDSNTWPTTVTVEKTYHPESTTEHDNNEQSPGPAH